MSKIQFCRPACGTSDKFRHCALWIWIFCYLHYSTPFEWIAFLRI